jgi:hypothetical protein
MACAVRDDQGYTASASERVGPLETLFPRLQARSTTHPSVLIGMDFPIGLPLCYAQQTGIGKFLDLLAQLGQPPFEAFYTIAEQPDEISLGRPFYPRSSRSGVKQAHLTKALNCSSMDELRRICERGYQGRRNACPLFWTLGGNSVGRGAICGWRDLLAPALREGTIPLALWPFHGTLAELLAAERVIVAETYPTEFYQHLGVHFPKAKAGRKSGKRVQADRQANAEVLLDRAATLGVRLTSELQAEICTGFGSQRDGEDRFDAVVGLLGMLNIVVGDRPTGEPALPEVRDIEGWILGQTVVSPRSSITDPIPSFRDLKYPGFNRHQ